jgi:DNA invertase Pin-like site-specific DNA recombinase
MDKRLAIYLRKSREDKTGDTFEIMRSRLIRKAEEMNRQYDIYEDLIGGDQYKEGLKSLLDNIEQYDSILTDAVDRIGRDDQENAQVKQILWLNDVEVITLNKTYDFDNESDEMMFGLESLFAKWEHKQIKRRLKNGKVDRFRKGQYTTGKPPIGYIRNPETRELEINEDEAEIVRFIFQLSADGFGARSISDKLNERGYRTQTGKAFPIAHIRDIQRNKTYIGTITLRPKNKRGEVTETIEIEDACPAIVPLELFIKANEEMERRTLNKSHTRGYVKSCLTGLVRCATCGIRLRFAFNRGEKVMIRSCDNRKNGVPTCRNSGIIASVIEEAVINDLRTHRDALRDELEKLQTNNSDDTKKRLENDLRAYDKRLKDIDIEDDRLDDLALDGLIKKDKLKTRKDALEKESEDIKLKIKVIREQLAHLSNQTNVERIESTIETIDHFNDLDLQTQNKFLKHIIDHIKYERYLPDNYKFRSHQFNDTLEKYPPSINIQYRE